MSCCFASCLPSRHDAKQQDSDYLQLHTTHTDRTTLLRTNLPTKCAYLPVAIYSTCTPDDGWMSPETCRVKAFAKNETQLLHLVGIIITTKAWCTEPQILSPCECCEMQLTSIPLFKIYTLLCQWLSIDYSDAQNKDKAAAVLTHEQFLCVIHKFIF